MVASKGDLARDDLTELREGVLNLLGRVIFRDAADEQVVFSESLDIGAKKFVLEGEGTALFTVDVEVAECLADFVELCVVIDLDNGGVEGLVEVTTHLGLALDVVAGFVFDDLSELRGGELALGQIVEVDEVGVDAG
jgi:hypothetical protein